MTPRQKAARIGDRTDHNGTVTGPGVPTVLIEGLPAAVAADPVRTIHNCVVPPQPPHPPGPFAGVTNVLIGGSPALRAADIAPCGARVTAAARRTVEIGDGT